MSIIDFGTSTELYTPTTSTRVVDQPIWLAPEVVAGLPYWEASDVYSYGMVLWELVARAHPFGEFTFSSWMAVIEDQVMRGIVLCAQNFREIYMLFRDTA